MRELTEVFRLGAAYGYSDWLVLDLTVVRGLAYYTGIPNPNPNPNPNPTA